MTAPEPPDLPRLVDVKHVAKRTGNLNDDGAVTYNATEVATVEDYIESVTAVLLDEGLETWTSTTAPARVRVIVVDAVERRLNNPEQLRQRSLSGDLEVLGDVTGEWLTDDELKTVRRLAGKGANSGEGAIVTSSATRLAPERLALLRSPFDDDEGHYYATYVL